MSYGVVRVQKFRSGSVKGIQIHDRREKDGISHTNKDIDWSRTYLNYDLCPIQNENFNKAVKERIEQLSLKRSVRKDAVVMAQVLVTSDYAFFEGLTENEQKQFFQDSYEFLKKRYGKENVISATVHLDESTPHMHFNFVPVTLDERLSAKRILTRQSLIEQQDAFFEKVGKNYGLQRGERGGNKVHLETAEFKKQMAIDKAIEADRKAQESLKEFESIKSSINDLKPLQAEYEAKMTFLNEMMSSLNKNFTLPEIQPVEKGFLRKEKIIELPFSEWQNLKENIENSAEQVIKHARANEQATEKLNQAIEHFSKTATGQYIKNLEGKVKTLGIENNLLSETIDGLEEDKRMLQKNFIKDKEEITKSFIGEIMKFSERLEVWERVLEKLPKEMSLEVQKLYDRVSSAEVNSFKSHEKKHKQKDHGFTL